MAFHTPDRAANSFVMTAGRIDSEWLPHEATRPALIRDIFLQLREYDIPEVEAIREAIIGLEKDKDPSVALFYQWYRRAAVRGSDGQRLISWKQTSKFDSKHLFFRSLDTGRLLSMALADFRVQFSAYQHDWDHWSNCGKGEETDGIAKYLNYTLITHMHTLLVLRNFHDMGAADIPFIFVDWTADELERVLDYFVALSAPKEERDDKRLAEEFDSLLLSIRGHGCTPCMYQADLITRALFSDPAVEYLPPFVVFQPIRSDRKARVLFRAPDCAPPLSLLQSLPNTCGGTGCDTKTHPTCGAYVWDRLHVLRPGSHLVRPYNRVRGVLCNHWPCHTQEGLVQCSRCKEVRYCCPQHQAADWHIHKRVCEAR
ncbi:hypothetical protein AURDEDRAFT_188883 [Auricularia subglabra TFB-10046 SS5]|uniref:MYND-type domain-containing protein n=1 Tax=Auricularia subglabra (strain TFB-10046 / SS5) TaxID=717982 RepID=J0LDY2_AURST|nr:hypothetical protein AURDEDRAFT_188883 [Auricularia subglabra TFB-10046 SS5]